MTKKLLASRLALALGIPLAVPAMSVAVQAAETAMLEEVVVTARKREESIMRIPVSVSVIDSGTIQQANLSDINDLANVTPGLKFNTAFGRQADRPVIRGISSIFTGSQLAGYFVDGIYVAGSLQTYDLDAIERVEVLKGPQSAVYGRRTFSGAINYVTQAPTEDLSGKVTVSAGENGYQLFSGSVSDTVGVLGYRVNARTSDYDGDFKNTKVGGPDVGGESDQSINGTFIFTLSDDTSLRFNASYTETDDDSYAIQLQPSSENNCTFGIRQYYCGTVKADTPISLGGVMDNSDYGVESETLRTSIRLTHRFDFAELTWTSAYNEYDNYAGSDQSFKGAEQAFSFGFFGGGPLLEPATAWHTQRSDTVEDQSHELWLRGSAMDDRLSWSTGAYYYDEDNDGTDRIGDGSLDGVRSGEVTNIAVMGAVEYRFSDSFVAGLELRYADDEVTLVEDGVTFNENFDSLTHRLTGSWYASDDTMVYGSWSTGTLPGTYNTDARLPSSLQAVEEGELEQFEIGVKSSLTDSLNLTAAVYMMEWTNQARSEFYTANGTISPGVGYRATQGSSDINGVEVDLKWQAATSLLLSAGFAYQDSEIKDFISTDAKDKAITGDGDVSGAQMPLSPELEAHASATYTNTFSNGLQLTSRLDASYQDKRYIRTVNRADTGSETLVGLNVALAKDGWRVALWGKNLTDEDSAVSVLRYVETDGFLFGPGAMAVTPRPGREFGVTASYEF